MSTTSPAVPLTLDVAVTIADPTAAGGNPAASVQLQNASAFALSVLVGGETYTLPSFTAQTLPTASTGAGLVATPTSGPVGSQGNLTAVWLLQGEAPPVADGQLTGAAQYAQGLASVAGSGTLTADPAPLFHVPIEPTTRTLILELTPSTVNADVFLTLTGNSGITYYADYCYLGASTFGFLAVIPFPGSQEDKAGLVISGTGATPATPWRWQLNQDTAAYDESLFYHGRLQVARGILAAAGSTTFLTGPARLLTANLRTAGTAAELQYNGQDFLAANSNDNLTLTFPANVKLGASDTLALVQDGAGASEADILFSHP